jgi:outer membrane protein assembly factor BamB
MRSFVGDGGLVTAPIVIDDAVIIGSSTGNVYALEASTGNQLWTATASASIQGPDEQSVEEPLVGLGVGGGYLLVPASDRISAWRLIP